MLDEPIRVIRETGNYCVNIVFSDHRLILQPDGKIYIINNAAGDVNEYHQISINDFKQQYHDYRGRFRGHNPIQ